MQLLLDPTFLLGLAAGLLLAGTVCLLLFLAGLADTLQFNPVAAWRRYRARRLARREVQALGKQAESMSRCAAKAAQKGRPYLAAVYLQSARSCSRRAFALSQAHQAVRS